MNTDKFLNYDLAYLAGSCILLIVLIYFFSAEAIRTISYMLMLCSYVVGRYVGEYVEKKRVAATQE